MIRQFWSIARWIPLGIGLLASVILVVLVTYDFTTWYIKTKGNPTMRHGKPKLHLYWIPPRKGHLHKTACGKRLREVQVTTRLNEVTCKVCRATVYGRDTMHTADPELAS